MRSVPSRRPIRQRFLLSPTGSGARISWLLFQLWLHVFPIAQAALTTFVRANTEDEPVRGAREAADPSIPANAWREGCAFGERALPRRGAVWLLPRELWGRRHLYSARIRGCNRRWRAYLLRRRPGRPSCQSRD